MAASTGSPKVVGSHAERFDFVVVERVVHDRHRAPRPQSGDRRDRARERGLLDATAIGRAQHDHGEASQVPEFVGQPEHGVGRHRLVDVARAGRDQRVGMVGEVEARVGGAYLSPPSTRRGTADGELPFDTRVAEAVSRAVEEGMPGSPGTVVGRRRMRGLLRGRNADVDDAATNLVKLGFLVDESGPGAALQWCSERPYRAGDDVSQTRLGG